MIFHSIPKIKKDDSGWTLLEMLIVMAIIGTLFAISWAGFFGLRRTMKLHQSAESLRSDLAYAQRSAMLTKRSSGENWVRGIGVSLVGSLDDETLDPSPGDELSHRLFKWCSDSKVYVDFVTNSDVVGFTPPEFVGISEVPEVDWEYPSDGKTFCDTGPKLVPLEANRNVDSEDGMDFEVTLNGEVGNSPISFVVFESVTGYPYFFRQDGSWVDPDTIPGSNYDIKLNYNIGNNSVSVVINEFGEIYKEADV